MGGVGWRGGERAYPAGLRQARLLPPGSSLLSVGERGEAHAPAPGKGVRGVTRGCARIREHRQKWPQDGMATRRNGRKTR